MALIFSITLLLNDNELLHILYAELNAQINLYTENEFYLGSKTIFEVLNLPTNIIELQQQLIDAKFPVNNDGLN